MGRIFFGLLLFSFSFAQAITLKSQSVSVQVLSPMAGTGFTTRPYLFQGDRARLLASIAANDPEATGTGSNDIGSPMGFLTVCRAALADRANYNDVPTWQLAFAGWLTNDNALLDRARDEALAITAANPDGVNNHGEDYQHIETAMLNVAGVADLAFSRFTTAQLAQITRYVNGSWTYWNRENIVYWPGDYPRNNYWQNAFLGSVIAGISTEGFNPLAGTRRQDAQRMANRYISMATPPAWTGPMQEEGHYYSTYVRNVIWGMKLYDSVMGTNFLTQSGFSATQTLNMLMYETRPHLAQFFEVGSEAADSSAPFHATSIEYWSMLMNLSPTSAEAGHAKSILTTALQSNFWYRGSKAFINFFWNIRSIPARALNTKTDRLMVTPSPGAGLIGMRSQLGFDTTARASLVFGNKAVGHGNPDAPGFQWAEGANWIVTDPEFFNSSGVMAESGTGIESDVSNIVTLDGSKSSANGESPQIVYAEDQRASAVPHFYQQINAQPYWTMTSTYRRDYVWLDDLQVVVIYDRIDGTAGKRWRMHVPAAATISGRNVSYTVGGKTVIVRDLFSTSSSAWSVENLNGSITTRDVWRISQPDAAANYNSVKVVDIGGRVTSASATFEAGTLSYLVNLVVSGSNRTIRFYQNGTHAVVQ